MKVNLRFESKDPNGDVIVSNFLAVMEIRKNNYKIVYMEDLSGEGISTKSTIMLARNELRLIRDGEIKADFLFGTNMVHNTAYKTVYGDIPVTLQTKDYSFDIKGAKEKDSFELEKSYMVTAQVLYDLIIDGAPQEMNMKIYVTSWDENINV
ncbi:MAG: DUF1934 domain-containing protein [Lachnospiraceae bacterium]|nr:DUF1934 domain-containing protein [Lachnospiraceae bacterium]